MMAELSPNKLFGRLFLLVVIIFFIPILYNFTGIAQYGYGYSFGGLLLWAMSPIVSFFFWVGSYKWGRRTKFSGIKRRTECPKLIIILSWLFVPLYVYFVFISRLPSGSSFMDIAAIYKSLGPTSEATPSLSILGGIAAIVSPISLLILPYAIDKSVPLAKVHYFPTFAFIVSNLLMGKRQVFMFFLFLIIFSLLAQAKKISFRKILAMSSILILFFSATLYVGFVRSGFTTFEVQIAHNSRVLEGDVASKYQALGLVYLYVGGGPEVLSVATDHFQPNYLPFSVTNSFILRRINSFVDYVDYEADVVPYTSGILEQHLGSFGRIWAGGNLQLFAEGGYLLTVFWYSTLFIWFRYIRHLARKKRLEIIDLAIFCSVFVHHLFVFPLRDQLIFFAFLFYCLLVLSRHVRWHPRKKIIRPVQSQTQLFEART